jgi:hypothetical protein
MATAPTGQKCCHLPCEMLNFAAKAADRARYCKTQGLNNIVCQRSPLVCIGCTGVVLYFKMYGVNSKMYRVRQANVLFCKAILYYIVHIAVLFKFKIVI